MKWKLKSLYNYCVIYAPKWTEALCWSKSFFFWFLTDSAAKFISLEIVLYMDINYTYPCIKEKSGCVDYSVISCLMETIGSDKMSDECEERLMEIQYFVSRDFK